MTEVTTEKDVWEDRFFALVAETGNVTKAAKGVRISRQTVYRRRRESEDFAARWKEAEELGATALEDEARRRALKESDTLLIFLLKGHYPEKYRDTVRNIHGGDPENPIHFVTRELTVKKDYGNRDPGPARKLALAGIDRDDG